MKSNVHGRDCVMISNLNLAQLKELHEDDLLIILNETILAAEEAKIDSIEFLEVFGLAEKSYTARQIWQFLVEKVKGNLNKETQETLQLILTSGSLSTRILNALKGDVSEENIFKVYRELAVCLQENKLFVN